MPDRRNLVASELYALSLNTKCEGPDECHWCAAPCKRLTPHDDPPPVPFVRSKSTAKRPANSYTCVGCWHFRRKNNSITFLDQSVLDKRSHSEFGWYLTERGIYSITPKCYPLLYDILLKPPLRWSLSLLDGPGFESLLQLALCNDLEEDIRGSTELKFTINNVPHTYTIYELEELIKTKDTSGREPGAIALYRLLGEPPSTLPILQKIKEENQNPPEGRGRPPGTQPTGKQSNKIVR